jgi:DNA sulfur modification protein DndD
MIIKQVKIQNFLSYYDIKKFEFNSGLNIILGNNGEGKTKFFDALEWLFYETKTEKDEVISKKKLELTTNGDKFIVSVEVEIEHNNETTLFVKSFEVEKIDNLEFKTSKIEFVSVEDKANGERIKFNGLEAKNVLNFLFPSEIRKYSMFRGESSLNIFSKKKSDSHDNALINLVNLFSDSNIYQKFAIKASALKIIAEFEKSEFNKKNAKNEKEYNALDGLISIGQREIERLKEIIRIKHDNLEITKEKKQGLDKYITNAKANEEITERITSLLARKKIIDNQIDEQYNNPLLDDLWLLIFFEDINKQFSNKISNAEDERRLLQQSFDIQKGETKGRRELQDKLLNGSTPLPIGTPDRRTMEEMLKDEICKVCNRAALKGTDAYNYMESNLKEFLNSLEPTTNVEIDDLLYKNNYIKPLVSMSLNHENFSTKFKSIEKEIKEKFELNETRKETARGLQQQLDQAYADKAKIFGEVDQTDEKLSSIMTNYLNWTNDIVNGEKEQSKYQNELDAELKKLKDNISKRDQIDLETGNTLYTKKYNLINDIEKIFIDVKDRKFEEYIHKLEEKSNEILRKINIDSFVGKIKFHLTRFYDSVDVKIELVQKDDTQYNSPNTSLATSMHIAVLFAISELASVKKKEDYPLIFDAPTSSFGEPKTSDFLNQLYDTKNQKILLLKDFVAKDENDKLFIKAEFNNVKRNKAFWIKLERPFDNGLLHTINTIVEEL